MKLKQAEIVHTLFYRIFELESGWYSEHYHKGNNGNWFRESYPIPVIGVKGFCDIEIQFDKISVSTKLKRNIALAYSFEKFAGYEFEAYGVEDYLADFYHSGQTVQELKENVRACDDIITIDLSPQNGDTWSDYARTIILQNGKVVDIDGVENAEWKQGLFMEELLHSELA